MQLIKNEWIKIWSQRNAQIMLLLVIIAIIGFASLNKYFSADNGSKEERIASNEEMLEMYDEWMTSPDVFAEDISYYEEQKQLTEYRIANDLPSESGTLFHENLEQSVTLLIMLVGIFTMVIAASIVSNEYGTGTIKMLLTRPVARWKILLSKLLASMAFGVSLFVVGIVVALAISFALFPQIEPFTLSLVDGEIVKEMIEISYGETILYNGLSIIMTILFAFMLGSLFGSSTLAVSLALIIFLMGSMITMFISQYDFAKYIWFANDLSYYAPGSSPMIPDLTLGFAATVNAVYAVIFLVVTFVYFMRRDITA